MSVWKPLWFLVCITDLDNNIASKLFRIADSYDNTGNLKMIKLVKWSEMWQMVFNFNKCKCLHLGHKNANLTYKFRRSQIIIVRMIWQLWKDQRRATKWHQN